jgi:general secretion pathway protein M
MNELLAPLRQRFETLQPRERQAVGLLAGLMGLFLLWLVAVAPAWRTLRDAPAEREKVEQSQLEMQAQAAEAQALRAVPPVSEAQSRQALEAACARLGPTARLQWAGGRALITVQGLRSEGLSALLGEARGAARAHAVEAQLSRSGDGYSGSITLAVPGGAS